MAARVRRDPPAMVTGIDADVWLVSALAHEDEVAAPHLPGPDVAQRAVLRVGVLRQPHPQRVPEDPLHVARAVEGVRTRRAPDIGLAALRPGDPDDEVGSLPDAQPRGVMTCRKHVPVVPVRGTPVG